MAFQTSLPQRGIKMVPDGFWQELTGWNTQKSQITPSCWPSILTVYLLAISHFSQKTCVTRAALTYHPHIYTLFILSTYSFVYVTYTHKHVTMKAARITKTVAIVPVPIVSCSPIYLSARTVPASKSGTKWQPVSLSLYWAQERKARKFYLLQMARKGEQRNLKTAVNLCNNEKM